MKRIIYIILVLALSVLLFSCDGEEKTRGEGMLITDDLGNEVTVYPDDRIGSLHASFADCFLLAGGKLSCVTADAVEDHGLDVGGALIVGTAKTVDTELLLSSGTDLLLLSADLAAHLSLKETLSSLGIRCLYFRVDTFEDYGRVMSSLCKITGREDLYRLNVTEVSDRIDTLISSVKGDREERTVLLIRAYSTGFKAKGNDNLAGFIISELGLTNLAEEHPSLLEDISLEKIIEWDPDFIIVLTMGSEDAARAYLASELEGNPAFAELKAVKGGGYRILPKELFHYKPNERWDESYEYLAKIFFS